MKPKQIAIETGLMVAVGGLTYFVAHQLGYVADPSRWWTIVLPAPAIILAIRAVGAWLLR